MSGTRAVTVKVPVELEQEVRDYCALLNMQLRDFYIAALSNQVRVCVAANPGLREAMEKMQEFRGSRALRSEEPTDDAR